MLVIRDVSRPDYIDSVVVICSMCAIVPRDFPGDNLPGILTSDHLSVGHGLFRVVTKRGKVQQTALFNIPNHDKKNKEERVLWTNCQKNKCYYIDNDSLGYSLAAEGMKK